MELWFALWAFQFNGLHLTVSQLTSQVPQPIILLYEQLLFSNISFHRIMLNFPKKQRYISFSRE